MSKRTLLTVSGVIAANIRDEIGNGQRPRADYFEIASRCDADLLDYAGARAEAGAVGAMLEKIGGANMLLAYACWKLRGRYRAIFTDGEQVGLPLAALLKLTPGVRPRHLMLVHVLSEPKKMFFLDRLGVHSCIDRFLTYSSYQQSFIGKRWGLGPDQVLRIPFMVDQNFFSPQKVTPRLGERPLICAVGLERRDYVTLLKAVDQLDLQLVIAAASPWSKRHDGMAGHTIPGNVTVRKFSQYDLRQLYADSHFMVMPLEDVKFQAGITAMLECMAMEKPVLCSRVVGQTDVIVENETGRYVPPGHVAALRAEIERMLAAPSETKRMGIAARRVIESEINLDLYAEQLSRIVDEVIFSTKRA